jgi:hypothetical protein
VTALAQRYRALDQGNMVRLRRAEMKHAIAAGDLDPTSILRDTPWYALSMRVLDLVEACPGVAEKKLRRLNMAAAAEWVNLLAPLGELTERQKNWLAEQLPDLLRNAQGR